MKLFFALVWLSLSLICGPNVQRQNQNGIIKLTKNQNGVWIGRRDIVLGLNIPNYK
jgi:hypothetical protein